MSSSGFSSQRIEKITQCLQSYVDKGMVAGAVGLVCRHNEVAFHAATGVQDLSTRTPITTDTLFRIASMTKPVTSVAALMLIEDGVIRLDDSIERWFPEFADMKVASEPTRSINNVITAQRGITVRDLLLHRSGLCYPITMQGDLEKSLRSFNSDIFPTVDKQRWLQRLAELPLCNQPGAGWHYGFSTDILGLLIERASGIEFPLFLAQRIFDPLGMQHTSFWVKSEDEHRFSTAYVWSQKLQRLEVHDSPKQSRWINRQSFPSGGAGLISTASDYLKFAQMLGAYGRWKNRRYLARKSIELMCRNHLTAEERATPFLGRPFWQSQGFGLGVAVTDDIVYAPCLASTGAVGWPGAYGTTWVLDFKEDLIAILMVQLYWGAHCNIAVDFQNAVYQAIDD